MTRFRLALDPIECYLVLLGYDSVSVVFYWVLPGFSRFNQDLPGYNELKWVSLGSTLFCRFLLIFNGFFYRGLLGFKKVLQGYTVFDYEMLLGFTGFLLRLTRLL